MHGTFLALLRDQQRNALTGALLEVGVGCQATRGARTTPYATGSLPRDTPPTETAAPAAEMTPSPDPHWSEDTASRTRDPLQGRGKRLASLLAVSRDPVTLGE